MTINAENDKCLRRIAVELKFVITSYVLGGIEREEYRRRRKVLIDQYLVMSDCLKGVN